jgi:hypothetical protein
MLADRFGERTEFERLRSSHNLAVRIDEVSITARVAGEHTKINLVSVLPQHGIVELRRRARKVGFSDDVTAIIDPVRLAVISAESA